MSETFKCVSRTTLNMSLNLKGMAKVLKADEKYENQIRKETQRRTIQNNFDAIRYCSPTFKNLVLLKIPMKSSKSFLHLV